MTIYSQHPNRGKVQILATYYGADSLSSSTVTSVDDAELVAPIVDLLNWISACVTIPLSVQDERHGDDKYYPEAHLDALTDSTARADLLTGTHSLWYELVKALLHGALNDLDDALADVPPPVRIAIDAELGAEARGLREAWKEHWQGEGQQEHESKRRWDLENPLVTYPDDFDVLGRIGRRDLNRIEQGISPGRLKAGVADLRTLNNVYRQTANENANFVVVDFSISDDPAEDSLGGYFVDVQAPMPNGGFNRDAWLVEVCQWTQDTDDEEDNSVRGEPILRCVRSSAPSVAEIVELLDRSAGQQDQIAAWATSPVGAPLAGTSFVVTTRFE